MVCLGQHCHQTLWIVGLYLLRATRTQCPPTESHPPGSQRDVLASSLHTHTQSSLSRWIIVRILQTTPRTRSEHRYSIFTTSAEPVEKKRAAPPRLSAGQPDLCHQWQTTGLQAKSPTVASYLAPKRPHKTPRDRAWLEFRQYTGANTINSRNFPNSYEFPISVLSQYIVQMCNRFQTITEASFGDPQCIPSPWPRTGQPPCRQEGDDRTLEQDTSWASPRFCRWLPQPGPWWHEGLGRHSEAG